VSVGGETEVDMNVTFSFLVAPGVYTASIPSSLTKRRQVCAIHANGMARTVATTDTYPDGSAIDRSGPAMKLVRQVRDRRGTQVDVLASTLAPDQWGLVWKLPNGYVATWGDPAIEDLAGLTRLARGLGVSADGYGGAKLELRTAARNGDIRRVDQRDEVTFYTAASRGLGLSSVTFSFAGALASDRKRQDGKQVFVTAASPLGVEVAAAVAPNHVSRVVSALEAVAGSVAIVG
jgi:hypothetical protein